MTSNEPLHITITVCVRECVQSVSDTPVWDRRNRVCQAGPKGPATRHTDESPDTPNPNPLFKTGTVWLLTPRSRPAWQAIANLLDDDQWHPIEEAQLLLRTISNLAPRTIENHLGAARARKWISRRKGRIRINDRLAFAAALLATEPLE